MLFRKRDKKPVSPQTRPGQGAGPGEQRLFPIEFDMMVKGSVFKRGRVLIRQYAVTVNGSTRLVTSGDVVDRPTYDALVKAGAIRPPEPPRTNPMGPADDPTRPFRADGE